MCIAHPHLHSHPHALLVFSGGQTNSGTQRTEAEGYERVLFGLDLGGSLVAARQRYTLEKNATDSFQNLLFSILRFRTLVGRYPEFVTVITHAFKEERFLTLHATAIKWPVHRIRVQGINPPFTLEELRETEGTVNEDLCVVAFEPNDPQNPYNWKPVSRQTSSLDIHCLTHTRHEVHGC